MEYIRVNVYDMNGRMVLTEQADKSLPVFEKSLTVSVTCFGHVYHPGEHWKQKTMVTKFIKQ